MPGRIFIIEELNPIGGAPPPGGFARFEWDARHRNIPKQPWNFGVMQRSVRTDYPGADDPTEQVLGPQFTPFSLEGRWDDRYNPQAAANPDLGGQQNREAMGGYARREREKFEAMVRRGNVVRLTFEDITIQGIITDFSVEYRRSWDIGYSFTMSPHHRQPGGFFSMKRSPRSALNAKQLRAEAANSLEAALVAHERAPRARLAGDLYAEVDALVVNWTDQLGIIDAAIEQRSLSLETEANLALLRLGAAFLAMSDTAASVIDLLKGETSATALDVEQAVATMDFDVWSRLLMASSRSIVVVTRRAASEIRQRARPNAIALYRPQEGEHLYSVSNRFYRTPHNWRAIYDRNGLESTTLTGEELLIIPEATGR